MLMLLLLVLLVLCHYFHCCCSALPDAVARGVDVFVSVYKIDASAAVSGALVVATLNAAGVAAPSAAVAVCIISVVTLQVLMFFLKKL